MRIINHLFLLYTTVNNRYIFDEEHEYQNDFLFKCAGGYLFSSNWWGDTFCYIRNYDVFCRIKYNYLYTSKLYYICG